MKQNELRPTAGSRTKSWRKGRGPGCGNGKTAGRGQKGLKARSGGGVGPQFEGGQMPKYRRMPKRGFNNKRFAKQYLVLNVSALEAFDNNDVVDAAALAEKGIITLPKVNDGIKILGDGELNKSLTVKAKAFTSSARDKIEQAGGTCEVI